MESANVFQFKPRYIVPTSVALLLTFGRYGIIPILNVHTFLDTLMNLVVMVFAPFCAFYGLMQRTSTYRFSRLLPIIFLVFYVFAAILLLSPPQYWPGRTHVISVCLSILLASQISRNELRRVRHVILMLAGLFSFLVLIYGHSAMSYIFNGKLKVRVGLKDDPSNVVLFPRILYVVIIICIITILIEKSTWIRIYAGLCMVFPFIFALSAASRGPLVAFVAAIIALVLGYNRIKEFILASIGMGLFSVVVYNIILRFFPLILDRFKQGEGGRLKVWDVMFRSDYITLFGHGLTSTYPHNVFLEFFYTYGMVGITLFLLVLATSWLTVWRCYKRTRDREVLWVICVFILQLTAQQSSLDIFLGATFWAAMALPLGFGREPVPEESENEQVGQHGGVRCQIPVTANT